MEYLLGACNSSNKSTINCWNCATGNVEHVYSSKHKPLKNSLCLLKNDYLLISELDKPLLHLWPINSQEPKLKLILPSKAEAVCIDNTCTYLLVGIGVSVYIWMISSGDLLNVLERNYQPISCIKISNTEHIVIGAKDGILTTYSFNDAIFKTMSGNSTPLYIKNDHSDAITGLDIGTFGCRSRVVSVSLDQSCRVYDLQSGDPLKVFVFPSPLTSVILDAMSWSVYVGDNNGNINIIEIQGDNLIQYVDEQETFFKGHSKKIISMDINLAHNLLATSSEDCTIIIWDLKSKKQIRIFKQELPPSDLLFIPAHSNIHSKTFKPELEVKNIKKTPLDDLANLEISIMQNEDIVFDDAYYSQNESVSALKNNNCGVYNNNNNDDDVEQLKVVNRQLYNMVNALIKKAHGPS